MILAQKVRLKHNKTQEKLLWQSTGTAKFIYNWTLGRQKENYENGGKFLSDNDLRKEITLLKKEELSWLSDVSILENLEHSKTNDLSSYGTKNYEKVWKYICQDVFGHQKNWIEKVIKPKWKDFQTNKISEVNTLLLNITIQKDDSFYI